MANVSKGSRWDLLWYVVIGFGVLLAIGVIVVYVPPDSLPKRKWIELGFYTFILYACLSKIYWRNRRCLSLWLCLLASAGAHVSVYVAILEPLDHWSALWYAILMPLEAILLMIAIWQLLHISPDLNVQL